LIHLACPDPDQPKRLRLWVEKSFDVKPPALGMTIGEAGNEYDSSPAAEAAEEASAARKRGKAPVKLDACKEWLVDQLGAQPARVKDVRALAVHAGFVPTTLYKAASRLNVLEHIVDGRKSWSLPDPSVESFV
jgi:hypothetical protein